MKLPGAVIFVNNELNEISYQTLRNQLQLTEIISKNEFDARVSADPNYPVIVRGFKTRVLVVLETFQDFVNRDLADIVMFIKQGMAYIERNNYGPPGLTYSIQRFNIYDLLRYNLSEEVVIYPNNAIGKCCQINKTCNCNNKCCADNCCKCGFKDLFETNGNQNPAYCPNPDNISNNTAFKNRK